MANQQKPLIGLIRILRGAETKETATCFAISSSLVLTTYHQFVGHHQDSYTVVAEFTSNQEIHATLNRFDSQDDWALLELDQPVQGRFLPISEDVVVGDEWVTFGYSALEGYTGMALGGIVRDPNGSFDSSPAIQLYCNEVAAGLGAIPYGVSGAPCIVRDKAVGIIRASLADGGRAVAGTAFAIPISLITTRCGDLSVDLGILPSHALVEYSAALDEYCQSSAYLSLQLVRPHKRLGEVFVSLRARASQPNASTAVTKDISIAALDNSILPDELIRHAAAEKVPINQIVVIGEPGAGKSTLLRHFAVHALKSPRRVGLSDSRVPLLIRLPDLAKSNAPGISRLRRAIEICPGIDAGPLFAELARPTALPPLLLLDALDEVAPSERLKLLEWLNTFLATHPDWTTILTTRPSAYFPGNLDQRRWKDYLLMPFSPEQTRDFAIKWFSDRATAFLREFQRVCPGEIRGTPLLSTIAAKVFAQNNALPESRSALYRVFVEIWIGEAAQRASDFINSDLMKVAIPALQHIALLLTEGVFERNLQVNAVAQLLVETGVTAFAKSRLEGSDFLSFLANRSGILVEKRSGFDFTHPTFREYLAAEEMIERGELTPKFVAAATASDAQLREVALFGLTILSDRGREVTEFLDPLVPVLEADEDYVYDVGQLGFLSLEEFEAAASEHYDATGEALNQPQHIDYVATLRRLRFVSQAIGEGVKVAPVLVDATNQALKELAYVWATQSKRDLSADPFTSLAMMTRSADAQDALTEFILEGGFNPLEQADALLAKVKYGLRSKELERFLEILLDIVDIDVSLSFENIPDYANLAARLAERGYPSLAHAAILAVATTSILEASYLIGLISQPKDIDRDATLMLGPGEVLSDESQYLIEELRSLSFDDVVITHLKDREFVVSDFLKTYLDLGAVEKRDTVLNALEEIVDNPDLDCWHRADCAIAIWRFFKRRYRIAQLLDFHHPIGLADNGARDHLHRNT